MFVYAVCKVDYVGRSICDIQSSELAPLQPKGGGLVQWWYTGLPTTGSWVQFPVEPKLDGRFIFDLIAMVPACPN